MPRNRQSHSLTSQQVIEGVRMLHQSEHLNYFDNWLVDGFSSGEFPRASSHSRDIAAGRALLSRYWGYLPREFISQAQPASVVVEAFRSRPPTQSNGDWRSQWRSPEHVAPAAEPNPRRKPTLRDMAEKLPPERLGAFSWDGAVERLVFKPLREHDPRLSMLKGEGWRCYASGDLSIWHAEPTLESYKVLENSGLEFVPTARASSWLEQIQRVVPIEAPADHPLFSYQREAVGFLLARKRAMLSLSPGLGKTLTAAFAASATGCKNVLVVSPASLLHYWYFELLKWGPHLLLDPMPQVWHGEVGVLPSYTPHQTQIWTISNPETVLRNSQEFNEAGFDLLVVDESIMYKHRNSARSVAMRMLAEKIPTTWLLTGAPATRLLDDMWHQFHILNPKGYSSYWRFAKRYCVVEDTQWGSSIIANKRDGEERIKENFSDVYFARSQDEVLDIPEWLFEDIDIPMTDKQERIYYKLQRELQLKLQDVEPSKIIRITNQLSLVSRSLQAASNPLLLGAVDSGGKWEALPELMEYYPGPFLLWVNYRRTGEILQQRLEDNDQRPDLINGSTPMAERNQLVEKFQEGRTGVLILNNQVGKFGFNLTRARTAIFLERGYDDSYFQCLHRFRRIGTEHRPIVVNLRSVSQGGSHTIDHVVHDTLDYRNLMIRKITCEMIQRLEEG